MKYFLYLLFASLLLAECEKRFTLSANGTISSQEILEEIA